MLPPVPPTSLRTALPRERVDLVPRRALVERLLAAFQGHHVVLVCAPGGYGKTATVVQAARALPADTAVAWLEAAADDDPAEWLRALAAALEPHDLPWRVSPQSLPALSHSDAGLRDAVRSLAQALAHADAPRGLIVLDDVHRWAGPGIQLLLSELVALLPERWSLVLVSREEPPGLSRLRVEGRLQELREAELRLDDAEVQALAGLLQVNVTPEALQDLAVRTQGWPAGVAMGLLALRGHGIGALGNRVRRATFDFLAEEVLGDLPPDLQQFLLRCSVLPELTEQRCRLASGDPRTPAWLHELLRRDLFVTVLDQPQLTLRLHDLFQEFLAQELARRLPAELPALLQRVGEQEPDLPTAIGFLLRAGAPAPAEARLLAAAAQLLHGGHGEQLLRLVALFPTGAGGAPASPDLAYLKGLCASFRFGMGTAISAMRAAAEGFERAKRPQDALKARLLGLIAAVNACRLDEALQFWDPARPAAMSPDTALLVSCRDFAQTMETGPAADSARHLAQAVDLLSTPECPPADWVFLFPSMFAFVGNAALYAPMTRLVALLQQHAGVDQPLLHGVTLALRAWRAFWQADFDAARALAAEAESEARWLGNLSFIFVPARMLRAIDAALHGRHDEARHIMQRLVEASAAGAASERQPELLLVQLQGLVAVACGDWPLVRQAAARMQAESHRYRMTFIEVSTAVLQAEVALQEGRAAEAAALLADAVPAAEATERWGLHARARAAWADAELQQGRFEAAAAALQPVLHAARDSGEVLGLLLRGPVPLQRLAQGLAAHLPVDDGSLLTQLALRAGALGSAAHAADAGAVGRLDADGPARFAHGSAGIAAPDALLTARELEVLDLVALGRSNKLIARELDLSPHTVKRHMARMLERTGLSSRGELATWHARTRMAARQPERE